MLAFAAVQARERILPFPPAALAGGGAALWEFLVHLRLPFQLALSVVPVWGVVWAGGSFGGRFGWVWLAWTVALGGGATAYNSYFDRDEGPVGGLRRPPRVRPSLLWLSLGLQLLGGVLLAVAATWIDAALYALGMLAFLAYSTPGVRTKSRPWRAMGTLALGSGALASLAGSLTAGLGPGTAWGMLAAGLFIAGFYPLTQVAQVEEDRRRGDRTFAACFGRSAAFAWAGLTLPVAAAMSLWRAGVPLLPLAGAAVIGLAGFVWWRRPGLDRTAIADWLAYGSAAAFVLAALKA